MQDVCMYCEICYDGNVPGISKYMCLNCLEHIVDKSMYKIINPLKDYDIIFDKNKIRCELCTESRNLFINTTLCLKHDRQLERSCSCYDDYYCDSKEDCYDYEENENYFDLIKNEINQMLKNTKLTWKIHRLKEKYYRFNHSLYLYIYQCNRIVCKFIYDNHRLALFINNRIYATSRFFKEFREMYFGELNLKLLEINEILDIFKNSFRISYKQMKNFDDDIKPYYYHQV